MDLKRSGAQASEKGPAETFTGNVRLDPLFVSPSGNVSGAYVTFEPGARSAWHTHPRGQTLIVTAGCGYVQSEGGPIKIIRPGDVVTCPPHEKHWHGASPTTGMTHIAIQEALDGKAVEWLEKVSDEQYNATPEPRPWRIGCSRLLDGSAYQRGGQGTAGRGRPQPRPRWASGSQRPQRRRRTLGVVPVSR